MKSFNVLITGCSKHSKGIVDNLHNNPDGVKVGVYGVDCDAHNLLREGLDGSDIVPKVNDERYIESMLDVCEKFNIDVILPYITMELEKLSINKELFENKGIKVSVSSPETLKIANNKIAMSEHFSDFMPLQSVASSITDVFDFADKIGYDNKEKSFCCKIADGCGGCGFAIVNEDKAKDLHYFNKAGVNRYITLEELVDIVGAADYDIILQEYIEGNDYSVCVLADGKKNIFKVGYVGFSMQYGAVLNGAIRHNAQAYMIADKMTRELQIEGNACYDFKIDRYGCAYLLEVNPRLNASLPFITAAGINLPYLRCKQLLGYPIEAEYKVNDNLRMQKYYETKYYEDD